jgi:hypothetical protein
MPAADLATESRGKININVSGYAIKAAKLIHVQNNVQVIICSRPATFFKKNRQRRNIDIQDNHVVCNSRRAKKLAFA